MGWLDKDKAEIAAWKKPKAGDMMNTPTGVVIVASVTEYSWTSDQVRGRPGYGNVPFWEGGNWRIFHVIDPDRPPYGSDEPNGSTTTKRSFLQRLFG